MTPCRTPHCLGDGSQPAPGWGHSQHCTRTTPSVEPTPMVSPLEERREHNTAGAAQQVEGE